MHKSKKRKFTPRQAIILVLIYLCSLFTPPLSVKAEDVEQSLKELILKDRTIITGKASLFAKTGGSDYYTLYPDGVEKESAYIGGFKSVQPDPLGENVYFYDTGLKVIARINIKDGKVYKVIGKPKSTKTLDYKNAVSFNDAELGKLTDFTFDKYGNILVLDSYGANNTDQRILKASIKDKTVKEIVKLNQLYTSPDKNPYLNYNFTFTLTGVSSDPDYNAYIFGSTSFIKPGYGVDHWDPAKKSFVVLKYDPTTNTFQFYGGEPSLTGIGISTKITLNPSSSNYYSLKGLTFDYNKVCYLSAVDYIQSLWISKTVQFVPPSTTSTTSPEKTFIGNDTTTNSNDLGDGGLAENASAGPTGTRYVCNDKSGDLFVADSTTNRIRKIFKDGGFITTAVGGGEESLAFGEEKSAKLISLNSPLALYTDRANNLFIAESGRILTVKDLVTSFENPSLAVKIANLLISKVAGAEVNDPKGEISIPDLKLDYTYAGDQTIEVKGTNIPDGTNIKLLTVGEENTNPPAAKLALGIASIPVKIQAGSTKVIKAETDPFIPAPGVYLPGTEPQIQTLSLPPEPTNLNIKRTDVNKDGNLIPYSVRFNFSKIFGWLNSQYMYVWDLNNTKITENADMDPDNITKDATFIEFGPNNDTYFLNNLADATENVKFSIWMKSTSGNITVPIGLGPVCSRWTSGTWTGCDHINSLNSSTTFNNAGGAISQSVTVTPTWQKFTVSGTAGAGSVFIGGLGKTINKKLYIWGARLEKS